MKAIYNCSVTSELAAKLLMVVVMLMYSMFSVAGAGTFDQRRIQALSGGDVIDPNSNDLLEQGETIEYDHTVLNLGNVDLQNIILTDITGTVSCPQTTLVAGGVMTCLSTHAITASEETAGEVNNSISVSAETASGQPAASDNTVNRQNNQSRSSIKMIKAPLTAEDVDQSGFNSVGDLIEYRFVVKNANSNDLDLITITEPDPTRIDTPIVCSGQTVDGQGFSGNETGVLQSQDAVICTAEYTIRQSDLDIGNVNNQAEVQALPPTGSVITGTAASVASVAPFDPGMPPDPRTIPTLSGHNLAIMLLLIMMLGLYAIRISSRN